MSNYEVIEQQVKNSKCATCNGLGKIRDDVDDNDFYGGYCEYKCDACNGTGWRGGKPKTLVNNRNCKGCG